MEALETERGDVLMSLQFVLIREEESGATPHRTDRIEIPAAFRRVRLLGAGPSEARGARTIPAVAPEPPLVDPATGARTAAALLRDLELLGATGHSRGGVRASSLRVFPLRGIRAELGAAVADRVLRALGELAPLVLEPGARLYLWSEDELALVLPELAASDADAAAMALETAAVRVLADRNLPSVSLSAAPLDLDEMELSEVLAPAV